MAESNKGSELIIEAPADKKKQLRAEAMRLPLTPGVYIMHDKSKTIIYIGKAKALKNRVSQYFGSDRNHDDKVRQMVSNVDYFEYIVTDSEYEALMLESSLIKQHKPKYNILLKDDKGYTYVKITAGDWPKVSETKVMEDDGATYLGPYYSAWTIKDTIDTAHKIFRLPTCNRRFPQDFGKSRPCLNYYIKQCQAPCRGKIKQEDYMESVNEAIKFIKGGSGDSIKSLTVKMEEAAERLDFEAAARMRDRIATMKVMKEKQKVVASKVKEQDVIALQRGEKNAAYEVFRFTENKLSDRESFITSDCQEDNISRSEFIRQYYLTRDRIPPVIIIDGEVEDHELVEQLLSEKRKKKVKILIPARGEQYQLVQMCKKNAAESLAKLVGSGGKETIALDEIKRLLALPKMPAYIESYDISNLSGGENVAGMVVFENGRPLKSAYRKFKIKTVIGQDDYGSMREVIERRFKEYEIHKDENEGFGRMPDLILLDGGKGHVAAIKPLLEQMGIDVPVYGMVKDDKHRTRAIAVTGGEIAINSNRSAFTLISKIQDEVHRYAIGFHRQRRKKSVISSTLSSIEGVGPTRAKKLMKHFLTVGAVAKAELKELEAVPGVTKPVAKNIYKFFHEENEG